MQNITSQVIRELEVTLVKAKIQFLIERGWVKAIELLEDYLWEKMIEGKLERLPLDIAVKYESILEEMVNGNSNQQRQL